MSFILSQTLLFGLVGTPFNGPNLHLWFRYTQTLVLSHLHNAKWLYYNLTRNKDTARRTREKHARLRIFSSKRIRNNYVEKSVYQLRTIRSVRYNVTICNWKRDENNSAWVVATALKNLPLSNVPMNVTRKDMCINGSEQTRAPPGSPLIKAYRNCILAFYRFTFPCR